MLVRPRLLSSRNKQLYSSFSIFVCLSGNLVKMRHDLRTTREPGDREEHPKESPEAEDREDVLRREAHVRLLAAALSSIFTAVNPRGNCGGDSVGAPRTVSRHFVKHIVGALGPRVQKHIVKLEGTVSRRRARGAKMCESGFDCA